MQAEIMALRHQLMVLQRTRKSKRLALKRGDRCVWVWLSRLWSSWRSALIIVKPETASPGTVKDSVGIGLGRSGTESQDVLEFRNKSAI